MEFETPEEVRASLFEGPCDVHRWSLAATSVQPLLLVDHVFDAPGRSRVPHRLLLHQAVAAVNTFNGEEIAGRKILVREDREDRDVKQYNKDHGIEKPEGARPPRRSRRGPAQQGQHGAKVNGDHSNEPLQEPSGLQVCRACPLNDHLCSCART